MLLDNYATHKHPTVIEWLGRHPRWTFHFTPTSATWLNAVEDFFAILTKRRLNIFWVPNWWRSRLESDIAQATRLDP